MSIEDLMALGVVGSVLSLLVQAIKAKHGNDSLATKMLVIGLSVSCGAVYYLFSGTPVWMAFVGVLMASQTFYGLILKK